MAKQKKDWYTVPATERQKFRLRKEGISFQETITKGEASDLIGNTVPPDPEEKAILKFFKVPNGERLFQTDARRKIQELFQSPQNVEKWEGRPADRYQKEIYSFFKLPTRRGLTWKEAKTFIEDELFKDKQKAKEWEQHEEEQFKLEEELFEREEWFEINLEEFNDCAEDYGCKKFSRKKFREIVTFLESRGITPEQIDQNPTVDFFEKALEIDPSLRRGSGRNRVAVMTNSQKPRTVLVPRKRKRNFTVYVIVVLGILFYLWLTNFR